jgi:hypothetical protein
MTPPTASPLPRTFLACLPFVWSHILFPGTTADNTKGKPAALLLLLILPGLLLYPCLSFYLFEPDEGRYAEIPREMLQRGDWIVPYLQNEPYLDKPPLLYWLVMISYRLCGIHDWAARLVPALAVHACILVVYLIGKRSLGQRAAFHGALLLTLTPGLVGVGRLLTMDGLLALWVTLGLLCAFEATRLSSLKYGWWLAAAMAVGLGLLTKGPVVLLLVVPPLWLQRRLTPSGAPLPWSARLTFLGVALALALPWYIALSIASPEFATHFLWQHNVVRFLQPFDHLEPVWYYLPLLAGALLPATLLALPFLRYLGSGEPATVASRSPAFGFMLLAGSWIVLFFSLSGCKLPTYILPALPLLTLALGHFLAHSAWQQAQTVRVLAGAGLAMQIMLHFVIVPWYAEYRSPLSQWPELVQHCADRQTPVVCYPRMCHSVAFYLGREDLTWYRSKEIDQLRQTLRQSSATVLLLSHRHSYQVLERALPPEFDLQRRVHFGLPPVPGVPVSMGRGLAKTLGDTALDLADLAVVRPRMQGRFEEKGHELPLKPID